MEKIHLAKLYHDNFITQEGGRDRFIAWAEKYNIVSRAKIPRGVKKAIRTHDHSWRAPFISMMWIK